MRTHGYFIPSKMIVPGNGGEIGGLVVRDGKKELFSVVSDARVCLFLALGIAESV